MSRNLPGFPGLGIMDSGAVWNGPMRVSTSACESGPRYLPELNSRSRIVVKASACSSMDGLFGGVYVNVMGEYYQ